MWLLPVGFTQSQTQPVGESVCVCVFVCGSHMDKNHAFHALSKSRIWLSHVFGLVSVVEKIMGDGYITALVCSCGTWQYYLLWWARCQYARLRAGPAELSWAGYLRDKPPDSQTIQICEKIYHLHSLLKKEAPTKMFCMNQFYALLRLTSVYTGWGHRLNHFKRPEESPTPKVNRYRY